MYVLFLRRKLKVKTPLFFELMRYVQKRLMLIVLYPLRLLPIKKNRIILDNNLAHNFSDNAKYIILYLIKHYTNKYEIILSVTDEKKYVKLRKIGVKPVKYHSVMHYIYAMTSSVFVTNSGGYSYLPLKKNQVVINTWHGGGAYKKIGVDANSADDFYKKELLLAAKKTTIFMSTGSLFSNLISKALLIPRDRFLEVGMPRNDLLVNGNESLRDKIRINLGLKDNEKLVLYAPTYRKVDDNTFEQSIAIDYGIDSDRVCAALKKRFGGDWKFAVRFHPQIKDKAEIKGAHVIDLTSYEDMQELLLAADVMINDFSSSMWDFMLTGKPSFLYAPDLQHYINTTDVYTPVEEWPFPKSTTNRELEKSILEFDAIKYKQDCESHYDQLGGCETGHATEEICKRIIERCR